MPIAHKNEADKQKDIKIVTEERFLCIRVVGSPPEPA